MSHMCGSTCKRKTGQRCDTCRRPGAFGNAQVIDRRDLENQTRHATPTEIEAALQMHLAGLSYRQVAAALEEHFGRPTNASTVCRWVRKARDAGLPG